MEIIEFKLKWDHAIMAKELLDFVISVACRQ